MRKRKVIAFYRQIAVLFPNAQHRALIRELIHEAKPTRQSRANARSRMDMRAVQKED